MISEKVSPSAASRRCSIRRMRRLAGKGIEEFHRFSIMFLYL